MPTYVYRCTNCDRHFEVEQRIVEDALTHCEICDLNTLKRVIQPVGVSFKGAGFHINDYSSSSAAPVTTAGGSPAGATADPTPTPTPSTTEPAPPPPAAEPGP